MLTCQSWSPWPRPSSSGGWGPCLLTGITNAVWQGNNRLIKLETRNIFGFRNRVNQCLRSRCATTRRSRREASSSSKDHDGDRSEINHCRVQDSVPKPMWPRCILLHKVHSRQIFGAGRMWPFFCIEPVFMFYAAQGTSKRVRASRAASHHW